MVTLSEEEVVRRARELSEDPVLVDALRRIEEIHLDAWRQTGDTECEKRERCWFRYQAVQELRQELLAIARGLDVKAFNARVKKSLT